MEFIRKRVLQGEFMAGAWCNLASSITVEMAARAGFDWILIDQEHGPGDNLTLLHQIQAAAAWPAACLVRIAWNEMPRYKRALDLGAAGIMVPYVQTRAEAEYAVTSLRYAPGGMRGVASTPRAAGFGKDFAGYYARSAEDLVTVVQVETAATLDNLDQIAAVDGVDVLFVGPLDLATSLGTPKRFEDSAYLAALAKVGEAAKKHGKAAGILLASPEQIPIVREMGYSFLALSSDGSMVVSGMEAACSALRKFK